MATSWDALISSLGCLSVDALCLVSPAAQLPCILILTQVTQPRRITCIGLRPGFSVTVCPAPQPDEPPPELTKLVRLFLISTLPCHALPCQWMPRVARGSRAMRVCSDAKSDSLPALGRTKDNQLDPSFRSLGPAPTRFASCCLVGGSSREQVE
ncbi:hypothetical protein B0J15DRAFT_465518 [Fusarium solani]|uniref:Secreted protein n=1 Tax=Fusarium solani TaxID=169388 RepID=A0A9P9HJI7_FUSSL|nr:uncharacterized protein B0J15DRAFT_465518 [Fusarium solani]KAH7258242.1 hypothetical protein B0J15DRAFT_465518 [Fusarium solani]